MSESKKNIPPILLIAHAVLAAVALAVFLLPVSAFAGVGDDKHSFANTRMEQEKRQIQLRLDGATEYEVVEIFNRIIESLPQVHNVERQKMVVLPNLPKQSYTLWSMSTGEDDTFAIESELYNRIKNIENEKNMYLNSLNFIPAKGDLARVESIKPYSATVEELRFILGENEAKTYSKRRKIDKMNRQVFGQGFD